MAAFNKFNAFVEHLAEGVHNLAADTLKIMLTNVAPVAGNSVKADLTEIAAGNGYTAGGITVVPASSSQTGGLYSLVIADVTSAWAASGGSMAAFQYLALYNDTPTSPADPLIGWWDLGAPLTLTVGNSLNLDLAATTITIQ